MAYIQNTYLAPSQRLVQALPTIYGVGAFSSRKICAQLGWSRRKLVKELAQTHRDKILRLLQRSGPTGVSLKRTIAKHVQESQSIGSYKGFRHQERLPVRGQRTHTNAKTAKKRATLASMVGSKRK